MTLFTGIQTLFVPSTTKVQEFCKFTKNLSWHRRADNLTRKCAYLTHVYLFQKGDKQRTPASAVSVNIQETLDLRYQACAHERGNEITAWTESVCATFTCSLVLWSSYLQSITGPWWILQEVRPRISNSNWLEMLKNNTKGKMKHFSPCGKIKRWHHI